MFNERFFVEGLAHASYLFGAEGAGAAAVVDPKRDVDEYIAAAERRGAKIVAIFETHPHADFVSGHVELARRTGATIYISEKVEGAQYSHTSLKHGEEVAVGPLTVRALDTPGHSPDSMSYYVEDAAAGTRIVYTGDILFVGDVGRPDLRDATADPNAMADALYDTLHSVLYALPEDTLVYPAHGAGSLCGRKIGTAPETTIGAEKRGNWANRYPDRAAFVEAMTSNLPDRPAYFSYDVGQNLKGAAPLSSLPRPERLGAETLREVSPDVAVIDTRTPEAYGAAHVAGSLNVGVGSAMFSTWAGFFVRPEARVVLVADSAEAAERAWLELARIGYDNVAGYVPADPDAWRAAGLDVRSTPQVDVCDVRDWVAGGSALLDVRTPGEWEEGRVDGAEWSPLPQLPSRLAEIAASGRPGVATMCGSGYRSSLAASLLERAGVPGVANVRGGWGAWTTRPCAEPDAQDLFHAAEPAAGVAAAAASGSGK